MSPKNTSRKKKMVAVPGSQRNPQTGAQIIRPANPASLVEVTVLVRRRTPAGAVQPALESRPGGPSPKILTREEFAATRGAAPEDIAAVESFAGKNKLKVVRSSAPERLVALAGTVAEVSKAFQVELHLCEGPHGEFRGRTGAAHVPPDLEGIVVAVLGLDNRRQATPHFRVKQLQTGVRPLAAAPAGSFSPVEVAQVYDFPASAKGSGECIALIELGGGYRSADLTQYFSSVLGISAPKVISVGVDGALNRPTGDANGPDGEVMLDIEVAGAVAPQATIAVYFGPNTDAGFYDAISAAVHDAANNPSVISISWGGPESSWTEQSLTQYDQLFQDAASLGVTVFCAAGDSGSTDGLSDGRQHVDFPASSPFAIACGGTKLTAQSGKRSSEVVWNELAAGEGASGGGISDFFPRPDYQSSASVPPSVNPGNFVGRGLPDVSGNADPESGYSVLVDGQSGVIGGTSAVAPLWAGLLACMNSSLGKRAGNILPRLYEQIANGSTFFDITSGDIGAFTSRTGWDPCTGWGSPVGAKILDALTQSTAARRS